MQRLWSAVRGLWRLEDEDDEDEEAGSEEEEERNHHHRNHQHHRNHHDGDEPSYRGGPDRTRLGLDGYEDDQDEEDFGQYGEDGRWSPERFVPVSRLSSMEERGLPGRGRADGSPGSNAGLPRVYSSGSIRERVMEVAASFAGRVTGSPGEPSASASAVPPPPAPSALASFGHHHEAPRASMSRPPSRQASRQLSWREQEWLPPRRRPRRRRSSGTEHQGSPATPSERSAGTAAGAPIAADLEGGHPGAWDEGSQNGDQPPLRESHSAKLIDLEQTLSATTRVQVERFKRTLQVLGLHAASSSSSSSAMALSSWLIAMVLLVATPLYSAYFVQPSDDLPEHELPFQTLVLMIQASLGLNSFVFIIATVKAHGMQGVLFLSAAANEAPSVQAEYEKCLQQSSGMLWQCLLPLFVMHILHKTLLYSSIPLKLLPFDQGLPLPPAPSSSLTAASALPSSTTADSALLVAAVLSMLSVLPLPLRLRASLPLPPLASLPLPSLASLRLPLAALVFLLTSASWLFSTSTFLFSCVIFWKVCSLQEFKMLVYREQVRQGADPAACLRGYMRITAALGVISKRFRRFLLHTFAISIFGGLYTMYTMIHYQGRLTFTNSGHLVVANIVSLFGTFLCMRSGSRLAHHHRRIVRVAALMHAQHTLEGHHASAGAMACSSRRWSAFRYERLMAEARTATATAAASTADALSLARTATATATAAASTADALSLAVRTASVFQRQIQEHSELKLYDPPPLAPEHLPRHTTVQLHEQDSEPMEGGLKQPLLKQQQQQQQQQQQEEGVREAEDIEQQEQGTQTPVLEGLLRQQQQQQAVYLRQASAMTRDSSPGGGEDRDMVGRLPPRESGGSSTNRLEQRIILFSRRQDAYMQRAALVEYLSNTSAGISIYGFVLDRFLIHTSIGALLTTTWFILGRSLSGSG